MWGVAVPDANPAAVASGGGGGGGGGGGPAPVPVPKGKSSKEELKMAKAFDDDDLLLQHLKTDHYFLHKFARGVMTCPAGASPPLPKPIYILDIQRLPYNGKAWVLGCMENASARPGPLHDNGEKNLPVYDDVVAYIRNVTLTAVMGSAVVVDGLAKVGLIYISWHYGGGQLKGRDHSPFLLLYDGGAPLKDTDVVAMARRTVTTHTGYWDGGDGSTTKQ